MLSRSYWPAEIIHRPATRVGRMTSSISASPRSTSQKPGSSGNSKSLMGRRAAQVAVDQQRAAAAAGQAGGQLAGHGRFALAVQGACDHDHPHRFGNGAVDQVGSHRVDRFDQQPVQVAVGGRQVPCGPGAMTDGKAPTTRSPKPSLNCVEELIRRAWNSQEGHGQSRPS